MGVKKIIFVIVGCVCLALGIICKKRRNVAIDKSRNINIGNNFDGTWLFLNGKEGDMDSVCNSCGCLACTYDLLSLLCEDN